MVRKVLVIEDNIAEADYAQTELVRAGFGNSRAVTTLSEGLELMSGYDAVLSDLFFPPGSEHTEGYSQRFLPFYTGYGQRKFPRLKEDSQMLGAVQVCARLFGVTPQEYVDGPLSVMKTPERALKDAKDAVAGVKNSDGYKRFLEIEEGIRDGTALPLGIIACERAKELGMPSVIVTSTYHHDDAFEPVRGLITVPYRDTLVDGKKDWRGGIESLTV